MERLSEHFSWEEALSSAAAKGSGIKNVPDHKVTGNIMVTACKLEEIRKVVGPLVISSWFRCAELNKLVGGAVNSAHMSGYAVDMHSNSMSPLVLCKRIVEAGIEFDQIIHEYGSWCHISFDPQNRGQVLTKFDGPYRKGLLTKFEYNKQQ